MATVTKKKKRAVKKSGLVVKRVKKKPVKKSVKKSSVKKRSESTANGQLEPTNLPQRPKSPVDLFKNSVCLEMRFSKPGNRRKVDVDDLDIGSDVDHEAISLSKELLDSPEYQKIASHDHKCREYVKSMSLDSPLKRGSYLIPIKLLTTVREELNVRKQQREALVDEFITVYPKQVKAAKQRLGNLYDPTQYPSPEVARNAFSMVYQTFSLFVPENIKSLGDLIYEEESAKLAESMKDLHCEISNSLRLGLKSVVSKLAERLRPSGDGKYSRLHESTVEKLLDFLNLFDDKNIVGDTECASLVNQIKKMVANGNNDASYLTHTLRNDVNYKQSLLDSFEEINEQLSQMVYTDSSRPIAI